MERSAALNKLRKLLGDKLGYRVDPKAPSPDEREAASAELPAARAELNALNEKREARYEAILKADAEYQSLKAASAAARERVNAIVSITMHYKFTVGTMGAMFFSVEAEGDSWEQVIAKIEDKRKKKEVA